MPDDTVVAEQEEAANNFDAGFTGDDETTDTEESNATDGEESEESDGDTEGSEGESSEDADEESDEELDDSDLTAQQKLERHARGEEDEDDPDTADDPLDEDEEASEEDEDDDDDIDTSGEAEYLSSLKKEILEGDDIKFGETSLKQFHEDYPDEAEAIITIGALIADKMLTDAVNNGNLITADEVNNRLDGLTDENAQLAHFTEIAKAHPDYDTVTRTKGWAKWVNTQPDEIQEIADSGSARSVVFMLDAYKEHRAARQATKSDEEAGEKKAKSKAIHGSSLREKKSSGSKRAKTGDKNDFQAGFDIEDDD